MTPAIAAMRPMLVECVCASSSSSPATPSASSTAIDAAERAGKRDSALKAGVGIRRQRLQHDLVELFRHLGVRRTRRRGAAMHAVAAW